MDKFRITHNKRTNLYRIEKYHHKSRYGTATEGWYHYYYCDDDRLCNYYDTLEAAKKALEYLTTPDKWEPVTDEGI